MPRNPYRIQGPALISFSMGRTSGFMLHEILQAYDGTLPNDIKVVTANTGKEADESLRFGAEVSRRWRVHVDVLEFDPHAPYMTKITSWEKASCKGEPLQAAIDTRPTQHLFNPVSRYCTGTTKQRRIEAFGREFCGWDTWLSVRGIRADEAPRIESLRKRYSAGPVDRQMLSLPLVDAKITKADIHAFWNRQSFDLDLPYDEVAGETIGGNCNGCPAMAKWKIIAAFRRRPDAADWWIAAEDEMERRISDIPRARTDQPERRHRFFKDGTSFRDPNAPSWKPGITHASASVIRPYSASIDAAVALVERLGFAWLRKTPNTMTVYRPLTQEQDDRKEWPRHIDAGGTTPALALCAALLSALDTGSGR